VTRCTVIRNPASRGRLRDDDFDRAMVVARAAGWELDVRATEHAAHATALAREAAEHGADVVLVHGGDGTVNEALNGIAGTTTALAVLPGGTANVWAREIGLPRKPVEAMRAVVGGEVRAVDLGRANGRYFLLMCGAGLDGVVVPAVGGPLKRWLGAAAYVVRGAPVVLRLRGWPAVARIDGDDAGAGLYWLLASNTRLYGGLVRIAKGAVVDDGQLDVALLRRGGLWRLATAFARLLRGRLAASPDVTVARARRIEIEAPGIPYQVDGEGAGETPLRIDVAPRALLAVVPRGTRSRLFATPPLGPVAASQRGSEGRVEPP